MNAQTAVASLDRDWASIVGLVLLYPGFFFYHYSVALLGMPAFVGGYYGPLAVCMLPALLVIRCVDWKRGRLKIVRVDLLFLTLVLLMAAWSVAFRFLGSGHQSDPILLTQSLSTILFWVVNYLLVRRLSLDDGWLVKLLLIAFFSMFAVSILNQQGGFFYARKLAEGVEDNSIATYQGFARSAFVTLLLLVASVRTAWLPWLYCLGIVLLFLLGARSEFVVFMLVGLLGIYVRSGAVRFGLFIGPLLFLGFAVLLDVAMSEASGSRVFSLLDLADGSPLESRSYLSGLAWKEILESPIIGDYGSHLLAGGIGSYAHNILSAWAGYGLVGFLLFAVLIFVPPIFMLLEGRRIGKMPSSSIAAFLFLISMAIMVVVTKSIYYVVYPLGWALYASHRSRSGG